MGNARWRRRLRLGAVGLLLLVALLAPAPRGQGPRRTAAARAAGPCGPVRTLRPAVPPLRGPDVLELQERLRDLGLYAGPVDGVYAGETVAAVRALQQRGSIPSTGEVDDRTWRLMAGPLHLAASEGGPPPQGQLSLEVDLERQTLTVLVDGRPFRRFPVAVGRPWSPSPPGEWRIVEKAHESGGAFGTRWLGLDVPWGNYGLHGTNRPWSIGRAASAGCIRLLNQDIEQLFEWVAVGTPVTIRGQLPSELWGTYRPGSSGLGVVTLQLRLREAGFPAGRADGRYGERTQAAVRDLQAFYGLPADGVVGPAELYLLGLKRPASSQPEAGRAPVGGGGMRLGAAP